MASFTKPSRRAQLRIKYALDRAFGSCLVAPLSPLLLAIALAIKLDDRGPVFFSQTRAGRGALPFRILKFRTMVTDSDELLNADGTVSVNRITRVGRFLRLTSLDELPQLLNIIRGEVSFIGPRPTLPEHDDLFTEDERVRFEVKPGITGWSQVHGRNTLLWSERLRYDAEYVRDYSLLLDLEILMRTIKVVITREGVAIDRNQKEVFDIVERRKHRKANDSA